MDTPLGQAGIMDVLLATLLGIGCVMSLPIYWWLFVTPFMQLAKSAGKHPAVRIP